MQSPRMGAAASGGDGGDLVVTGGVDDQGWNDLNTVEIYRDKKWIPGIPLPQAIRAHCQVYTGTGIYVIGKGRHHSKNIKTSRD